MLSTLVASLLLLPPIPSYAESAHRLATMEVREAIDEAYLRADPDGSHAWWRAELYMIAKREARGGADGLVGVHEGDSWLGRKSWEKAMRAGRLDPECQEHTWQEGEWGTRGLFGMIAAYHVGELGCVGPETMDDPTAAAHLALVRMQRCRPRVGRECSCIDHTRLWIGSGAWARRPLLGKRSRLTSVARQCGPEVAAWMFVIESGTLAMVLGAS